MPVDFGGFTLDESRRQLFKGAEAVHLSPKAFQLLSILVAERPRAVSKKDLQDRLWPDTFVTEGNLSSAVAELRSALGDDRRESRFIRTLYGFGYSFAATIDQKQEHATHDRARWKIAAFGLAGVIAISAFAWLRTSNHADVQQPIRSIAILPFDASDADRSDQHLGLGLPDLLITRLSNVRHVIVRPTSAVRDYAGRHVDSREAGRKLKVDAVVEGSIRTTADRVRVTVQLLDVRDPKPVWAQSFDSKRSDLFSIEDGISARVADALTTRLTPDEKTLLSKRYTTDPQAYDLYVQGRYQLERAREGEADGRRKAIELFEKALAKDPSYALAWAGYAHANVGMVARLQIAPEVAFPKAEIAAARALRIDPQLSEAHCAAAAVKMHWRLDFDGAEREFRRALELNPRNTIALDHYGFLLQCLGRFDEAITMRERLVEIDPLSVAAQWSLANAYLTAHQDARGIQQTMLVLAMNPNFSDALNSLTRYYTTRGEYDKAIANAEKNAQTNPSDRSLAFLGWALARAGKRAEANAILQRLIENEKTFPYCVAFVQIGLDNRDAAFPLLEKGVNDRSYVLRLKTEPIFDPLRSDPRFAALLQRAGFGS